MTPEVRVPRQHPYYAGLASNKELVFPRVCDDLQDGLACGVSMSSFAVPFP